MAKAKKLSTQSASSPSLSPEDIEDIRTKLDAKSKLYDRLSQYFQEACLDYKEEHPDSIRVVFSRVPQVKTIDSILGKIERCRIEQPGYRFEDLTDIAALTVLCAYESDVQDFILWLDREFQVFPQPLPSGFHQKNGHAAYHFSVGLSNQDKQRQPALSKLMCEIQVKTLLQEAFDAKSHDLAYKPRGPAIAQELDKQFVHLSNHLRALDGQSEFIKDLILREKHELGLRRNACLRLFVKDFGKLAEQMGIDPDNLPPFKKLCSLLEAPMIARDNQLCKLVAYCAVVVNHEYLKNVALDYATVYVDEEKEYFERRIVRGSIAWAFGRYEDALKDTLDAMSAKGTAARSRAANNLVYFISDWETVSGNVPEKWKEKCHAQARLLRKSSSIEDQDTYGFYLIAFATSRKQIDSGRALIRKIFQKREKNEDFAETELFFEFHEYVAVSKLLALLRRPAH